MTRMVHCVKLGREAEGLDRQPYPGALGKRVFEFDGVGFLQAHRAFVLHEITNCPLWNDRVGPMVTSEKLTRTTRFRIVPVRGAV